MRGPQRGSGLEFHQRLLLESVGTAPPGQTQPFVWIIDIDSAA
jgi:hypothetical protein